MKGTAEDIIGTLIDVVNQACQVKHDAEFNRVFCCNMGLSAYEDAFAILEAKGYAKKIKRGKHKGLYELAWEPKFLRSQNNGR